ncbi:MAG: hypothetical protein U5M51_12900 [Emticicia sp.]|nr:hypothetical protein [Emticicia sp.]
MKHQPQCGAAAAKNSLTCKVIENEFASVGLSPDYYFTGCGVLLQRGGHYAQEMGALDIIRNQCWLFLGTCCHWRL